MRTDPQRAWSPSGGGALRRAWGPARTLTFLLAVLIFSAGVVHGQITPLQDMVPLNGLETRTDDLIR
jgi:hypothetical protein